MLVKTLDVLFLLLHSHLDQRGKKSSPEISDETLVVRCSLRSESSIIWGNGADRCKSVCVGRHVVSVYDTSVAFLMSPCDDDSPVCCVML
jgi:hypothetical protein